MFTKSLVVEKAKPRSTCLFLLSIPLTVGNLKGFPHFYSSDQSSLHIR